MRSSSLALALCWLLVVGSLAAPALGAEPTAADKAAAKKAYTEARALAKAGKHVEALALFRRAHELAPTPVTRLDLALELAGQAQLVEAHALVASIDELPVTATETRKSKEARKQALELEASLAARIPRVQLSFDPEGDADVTIDGKPVAADLVHKPIPLDPGAHEVVAKRGESTTSSKLTLVEADRPNVQISFRPATTEPAAPPPTPPPQLPPPLVPAPSLPAAAAEEGLHPSVPILLAVGGAGLLTGVITGSVAWSQVGELEAGCPSGRCPPPMHDLLATHQALGAASTAMFVIGGASALAGGIVWLVQASSTTDAPPVKAGLTLGGVTIEGAF